MAKGLCRSASEFWWGITLAELVDRDIANYWRGRDFRAELWRHSAQALTREPLGFRDFVFPETSVKYEEDGSSSDGGKLATEPGEREITAPVEDFATEFKRLTGDRPVTGG